MNKVVICLLFLSLLGLVSCQNKSDEHFGSFDNIKCDVFDENTPEYDEKIITLLDGEGNAVRDSVIKIEKKLHVFKPCKKYVYKTEFFDKDGRHLASGDILQMATGHKWELDAFQEEVLIRYQYTKEEENKIRKYFDRQGYPNGNWITETYTGVIENIEELWIHPFRANQYLLTEVAPFPMVKKPIREGKAWTSSLRILEGWGLWENSVGNKYYEVKEKTSLELPFSSEPVVCYEIEATASFPFGKSKLLFYYSEDYGFIKQVYQFYNGEKLKIQLVELN